MSLNISTRWELFWPNKFRNILHPVREWLLLGGKTLWKISTEVIDSRKRLVFVFLSNKCLIVSFERFNLASFFPNRDKGAPQYEIKSSFPNKVYDDPRANLRECGLVPNATLHLLVRKMWRKCMSFKKKKHPDWLIKYIYFKFKSVFWRRCLSLLSLVSK